MCGSPKHLGQAALNSLSFTRLRYLNCDRSMSVMQLLSYSITTLSLMVIGVAFSRIDKLLQSEEPSTGQLSDHSGEL